MCDNNIRKRFKSEAWVGLQDGLAQIINATPPPKLDKKNLSFKLLKVSPDTEIVCRQKSCVG